MGYLELTFLIKMRKWLEREEVMELFENSAAELSRMLQEKEISSVELVRSFLSRIEAVDPYLNAFITTTPFMALDTAGQVDSKRMQGEKLHPLAGIPVAVKDNLSTAGLKTTCASRMLENYIPPYDATVVKALYQAGMPVLGKTNLDEFAMGSSTENSAFFPTRNPWDLTKVPGGSSGGSAVAVASAMAPLALGSDTGGSIRQPASLCGVTGLRPTYGRVSRFGLIAFASSLDQVGTLAFSAGDTALLLNLIAGHDPLDSTSLPDRDRDYTDYLTSEISNLRVGVIKQNVSGNFDEEVTGAVLKAASLLEKSGALVEEVSLPMIDYGLSAYYLIAPSEASSNLGRYDGIRYGYSAEGEDILEMFSRTRGEGFGPEVKRRIMIGTYALSAGYYDAYYLQAMKVRTMIRREYEAVFKNYDLLIGAASPTPAFKIGEKTGDPLQMYLSDVCNITDSLAGVPSLAVPGGLHSSALPVGLQLTAAPQNERILLKAARFFEETSEMQPRRPALDLKKVPPKKGEA
ncbi:MAG: Asp-tRNA(Asn)/Glu-tRNA(Gln) amidotransferase subunit GatA [Bacillota bacterium]